MRRACLLGALLALACDAPPDPADGGGGPLPDAAGVDASLPPEHDSGAADASATADGGACVPTSGDMLREGYCQQVMLAVLRSDDASPSLYVTGLTTSVGEGCNVVDRVEIRRTDGELLQTLVPASGAGLSARASTVAPELLALCDREDGRFDPFAVEVHGRTDGGRFVARCGAEAFGSGWPPDLAVTCHQNLPIGPTFMGSGMVQATAGFTTSEIWFSYPNEDGIVIDAVDPEVRIVPGTWGFGGVPIDPFDTSGWTATVSFHTSARTHVGVSLHQMADPLGGDLCPVPSAMPMPGDPVPPVFLARVRGSAGGRPFTSEAMISHCTRLAL